MRLRAATFAVALCLAAVSAFGQVGNSTITGIITDPGGAVIAGAKVEAKNSETGVVYTGASTATGDYTIPDLPVGTYTLTVTVMGFKTYTHSNMLVDNAAKVRQDVPLAVGSSTESVTVTAESSLLKTESADNTTNFTLSQLDNLPIFGIGTTNSGTSGYRNPYNTLLTMPGVTGFGAGAAFGLTVNGIGLAESIIMEGQDATDRTFGGTIYYQIGQPSVDSIQEMSYQVSNYAPEFGQAGSTAINFTFKGGTNKYHGSGYDNFVNEDLNAGAPFSTTGCIAPLSNSFATAKVPACYASGGSGGKYRPRNRRNDFGGTLGGPITIPKIYNGKNKTFFFWSYEQYAETSGLNFSDTVPTADYLLGNFGHISPNGDCSLCSQLGIQTAALGTPVQKDALGNTFLANTIYDPGTRGVVAATGLGFALPFQGNKIPATRFDPLYVKLQTLINTVGATAQNSNLTGNYSGRVQSKRYSAIPSIKIDHNIDAKDKLSFYYSENNTESQYSTPLGNADGLPSEIGAYRGTFIPTYTYRLNYDRTLAPTLLLHMGVGYYKDNFDDHAPFLKFDPAAFGLSNFNTRGNFPFISGMTTTDAGGRSYGGMQAIGTSGAIQSTTYGYKPTATINTTWVQGKHSYKFGADVQFNGSIPQNHPVVSMATGPQATEEPFTPSGSLGTFGTGLGYASWMLGDYVSTNQPAPTEPHYGSQAWDVYVQDSWKITRKITLDYGIRWDIETPQHEEYGRLGQLSLTAPNANAGGHPGATIFASNCGCSFYQKSYPYGIGPRLGIAYQINAKTVFRGGWGVTYPYTVSGAGGLVSTPGAYIIVPPAQAAVNLFVNEQTPGFIQSATWPVTHNIYPNLGTTSPAPTFPDANENRPPRIQQFSAGFQREITRSFVLEASYVGNRAAWLSGFLSYLDNSNHTQWQSLAALNIYPLPGTAPAGYNFAPTGLTCTAGVDCARAILGQAISTTAVIQTLAAAGLKSPSQYIPYNCPGTSNFNCFPSSSTIPSLLRPLPQYGATASGPSPTGNSKYDSLQIKATKRYAHGLTANGFFTWAQGFTRAVRQDFYNPASTQNTMMGIAPRTLNINFQYITPKVQYFNNGGMKFVNQIIKDWQISGTGNYQSAGFLGIPGTPNSEQLGTQDIYNGAPLYLDKNGKPTTHSPLNDPKSINTQNQVLNPAAWTLCPANTNCGNSGNDYLKGFRGVRHPSENAGIGRVFRIKESMSLQFRGDFINIFNRISFASPSTANPQNAITHNTLGYVTGGFGTMPTYINPGTGGGGRTGTLVMRFNF